jgi:hypothetical protein
MILVSCVADARDTAFDVFILTRNGIFLSCVRAANIHPPVSSMASFPCATMARPKLACIDNVSHRNRFEASLRGYDQFATSAVRFHQAVGGLDLIGSEYLAGFARPIPGLRSHDDRQPVLVAVVEPAVSSAASINDNESCVLKWLAGSSYK